MKRIVYIKAEVIGQQEKALTVRLLNGFGNPEESVHRDSIIENVKPIIPLVADGSGGLCFPNAGVK